MLRVFDFVCDDGHKSEKFCRNGGLIGTCDTCGQTLRQDMKLVAAPNFKLEGITGSFPGAYHAWEKKRAEKQKIQEQKLRDHGDEGWT